MLTCPNRSLYSTALRIVRDEVLANLIDLTLEMFICHDEQFVNKVINDIEKFQEPNCILQIIPRNVVVSRKQLKLASYLAFKAFDKRRNVSRKRHMEMLLYLFGERQIWRVLEKIRKYGKLPYLLVVVCRSVSSRVIENLLRNYFAGIERYCSRLEVKEGKDPLEVDIEANASTIMDAYELYELQGTDTKEDLVKAVLSKVASLVLRT